MEKTLLPLTKLVLAVSAIVQIISGLVGLLGAELARSILYPPPLTPVPVLAMQYVGAFYLANALGAASALRQNEWHAARTYLIIAGTFVAISLIVTLVSALTPPGLPAIFWLFIALSLIYLPLVAWAWRQESARAKRP